MAQSGSGTEKKSSMVSEAIVFGLAGIFVGAALGVVGTVWIMPLSAASRVKSDTFDLSTAAVRPAPVRRAGRNSQNWLLPP